MKKRILVLLAAAFSLSSGAIARADDLSAAKTRKIELDKSLDSEGNDLRNSFEKIQIQELDLKHMTLEEIFYKTQPVTEKWGS
ncbi:hypothetical protein WDW86_17855 [Bdellovibrionota bacterium FG-2]